MSRSLLSDNFSFVSTSECQYISIGSSLPRSPSIRLSTHSLAQVTVLFIDIKGFTSQCAAMPAGLVGEWMAEFYERVDTVAEAHGVSKVEARGDCCVCVAGAEGAVPSPALAAASADQRRDQASRMLAFAAALHDNLRTLSVGGAATAARMGVATGECAFLVSDAAAGVEAARFASVRGEAVGLASRMESLAGPGAVHVHRSTAHKWAAEAGSPPPPTIRVECDGPGPARAAVFDCAARTFRIPPGALSPPQRARGCSAGRQRSASVPR
jgi:class 3 adenylate cyclase